MTEPASIRCKNPGAMWGGNAISKRWGATDDLVLHDGQSNHIAVFPDYVHGAAAQFDLWRRSYTGLSLASAIRKWCGGNSPSQYVTFLTKHAGIPSAEMITADLLSGARGLALMKAQAEWEAGKPYPMSDAEWAEAQRMVFGGAAPKVDVTPHVTAASGAAAGAAAAFLGLPLYVIAGAVVVAAVVAFLIFKNRS